MTRLLVTGSLGQVGSELLRRAPAAGFDVRGADRADLDITERSAVHAALDGIDAVINAAAYTAVDRAESEPDLAFAVNADGPRLLARQCADRGIPLLHISTDYVFDGTKSGAWSEDDPPEPLNVYGASKLAGEEAVRETWANHVILRTSWVYAAHGHNFVRTMLRLGAEREVLRVVDDQLGTPTAAMDVAGALLTIASALCGGGRDAFGTYHYAAIGATSWFGLAEAVFERAAPHWGRRPRLEPIATCDYPTPARRPANSVLDCHRIMAVFDPPRRPWQEALDDVMGELLDPGQGTTTA